MAEQNSRRHAVEFKYKLKRLSQRELLNQKVYFVSRFVFHLTKSEECP